MSSHYQIVDIFAAELPVGSVHAEDITAEIKPVRDNLPCYSFNVLGAILRPLLADGGASPFKIASLASVDHNSASLSVLKDCRHLLPL